MSNTIKIDSEVQAVLNETSAKSERFEKASVVDKDIAILRYICGALALDSSRTITVYDETEKFLELSSTFDAYYIKVEDGKAILESIPDAEHDDITAEAVIDFEVGQPLVPAVYKAIKQTEAELLPQLQKVEDPENLSLMAKDILGID